jgi:hypothetical protein
LTISLISTFSKNENEPNLTQFEPNFLPLKPIRILIMLAARAARTRLAFKALLKGFKVI